MKLLRLLITAGMIALGLTTGAQAGVIWGNNASGTMLIEAFDSVTGARIKAFTPDTGNGRGIVVVNDILYYTRVSDGNIYKLNANTGAPLGSFSTGQSSLSTISYDGTNFWLADYSGVNKAYEISPTGTLIKTITLSNSVGGSDGLEFFNGKLISNRGDIQNPGIYDVYDLDGNVLQAGFITNPHGSTGIVFDGTNFLISNLSEHSIGVYSGSTGTFIKEIALTGFGGIGLEDLSVDFAGRVDTCGGPNQPPCLCGTVGQPPCATPVANSNSLIVLGLFLFGFMAKSRGRLTWRA